MNTKRLIIYHIYYRISSGKFRFKMRLVYFLVRDVRMHKAWPHFNTAIKSMKPMGNMCTFNKRLGFYCFTFYSLSKSRLFYALVPPFIFIRHFLVRPHFIRNRSATIHAMIPHNCPIHFPAPQSIRPRIKEPIVIYFCRFFGHCFLARRQFRT